MQRIYDDGNTLRESAEKIQVSYSTARRNIKRKQQLKPASFATRAQYRDVLAERKGFDSDADYEMYLAIWRQFRPENIAFSKFLRESLEQQSKSGYWLAEKTRLSGKMIYKYTKGMSLPSPPNFQLLSELLRWPYRSIDDLIANLVKK